MKSLHGENENDQSSSRFDLRYRLQALSMTRSFYDEHYDTAVVRSELRGASKT